MEDLSCWQEKFEVCIYAKRLIDKIEYLNTEVEKPVNIEEVKKGIYYARKYHGLQMRQSGEPYYSHPLEVAYMVAEYTAANMQAFFRTDILVTSILHDTIEDTALSKEKITEAFGWQVANQVQDLTRIKDNEEKISSAKMVELLYMEKKHGVLLIKLFDRLHNIQTIGAKSPEKIKKIVQETLIHFITLSYYLGLPIIEKQFYHCILSINKINFMTEDNLLTFSHKINYPFQVLQNGFYRNNILSILEL